MNRNRVLFLAVAILSALFVCFVWAIRRDIAFDANQWRDPTWPWDRWRMVEDLRIRLAKDRPTFDEAMKMLEGKPESQHATRNLELSAGKQGNYLDYYLGRRFPGVRPVGGGTIVLYFGEDGRCYACEVSGE